MEAYGYLGGSNRKKFRLKRTKITIFRHTRLENSVTSSINSSFYGQLYDFASPQRVDLCSSLKKCCEYGADVDKYIKKQV